MNHQKESNTDWIGLFALLLLVIGGFMVSYYYIVYEINSCTSNPLKYTSDRITMDNENNYSYVKIYIFSKKGDLLPLKVKELELYGENSNIPSYLNVTNSSY